MKTPASLLIAGLVLALPAAAEASTLDTLGFFGTGGTNYSSARGVSADGSRIVGVGGSAAYGSEAFLHDGAGPMGRIFTAGGPGTAFGISADGSYIVGGDSGSVYRYQVGVGKTIPFGNAGEGTAISDDGSIMVGNLYTSGGQSFWANSTGPSGVGSTGGGFAEFVSADGSTSYGGHPTGGGFEAFSWSPGVGLTNHGDLAGGAVGSAFLAGTPTGSLLAGYGTDAVGQVAASYTGGAWTALGRLAAGQSSEALGVDGSGNLIVGRAGAAGGDRAFVWDPTYGIQDLNLVLQAQGVNLNGFTLTHAYAISRDGSTIVGHGLNSQGHTEAFAVRNFSVGAAVPEPSSWALLLLSVFVVVRLRF